MLEAIYAHWWLKTLALALAFGIWVSVIGQAAIVQDFDAPLVLQLRDNHVLATPALTNVTVRLRGPEASIRRLDPLRLEVNVDLRNQSIGPHDVWLSETNLTGVPRGVNVEFFNPTHVAFELDRRLQRRLRVEPTVLGEPPDGYAYYGVQVQPERLLVEGPEAEVEALDQLRTNEIRLNRLTQPSTFFPAAVPDSPNVRVIDPGPLEIRVIVDAAPVERRFDQVAVDLLGALFDNELSAATLDVTLLGPPALLDAVQSEGLRAVVDVTGLEPREQPYILPVRLRFRDAPIDAYTSISVRAVSLEEIEVTIGERSPEE